MLEKTGARVEDPVIHIDAGGRKMRRDDDLIRKLMLEFEAMDEALLAVAYHLSMSDEERRTYYHLKCLADAGLLEEQGKGVFRMTNAGHDFCAAIRDDTIWRKMKDASAAAAGLSLGMMKDVGIGYLRARLIEMGVPLG